MLTALRQFFRWFFTYPERRCMECDCVLTDETENSFPMDGICVNCEAAPLLSRRGQAC